MNYIVAQLNIPGQSLNGSAGDVVQTSGSADDYIIWDIESAGKEGKTSVSLGLTGTGWETFDIHTHPKGIMSQSMMTCGPS